MESEEVIVPRRTAELVGKCYQPVPAAIHALVVAPNSLVTL